MMNQLKTNPHLDLLPDLQTLASIFSCSPLQSEKANGLNLRHRMTHDGRVWVGLAASCCSLYTCLCLAL